MSSNLIARSISPVKAATLFEITPDWPFRAFFSPEAAPWEWLPGIDAALASVLETIDPGRGIQPSAIPDGVSITGDVWLDPSVRLPAFACIQGPAWIGADTEIRPGCFIRGKVIAGGGCVLGNSCEYKNCLLMDRVETPHYNYVGDSILGHRAHLGAGAICANLRLDRREVRAYGPDGQRYPTGLRKVGAILGDGAEAGCNAVLQPGTILEKRAVVGAAQAFAGYLGPGQTCLGGRLGTRPD